jgi:hypothetical protein
MTKNKPTSPRKQLQALTHAELKHVSGGDVIPGVRGTGGGGGLRLIDGK